MLRRRRGFFHGTTRAQIYVALILGMVSSAYIWFPTMQKAELDRKARETKDKSEEVTSNLFN